MNKKPTDDAHKFCMDMWKALRSGKITPKQFRKSMRDYRINQGEEVAPFNPEKPFK